MSPARHIRAARQWNSGFGLVELMIALVLGLLLVEAAVQLFVGQRHSLRYAQALATLQGNARFALYVLERDLRRAGYSGCHGPVSDAPFLATAPPYGVVNVLAVETIFGDGEFRMQAVAPVGANLPGSAYAGSDALRIAYALDPGVRVTGEAGTRDAALRISGNPAGWEAGAQLLVTNCRQADLFTATRVTTSRIEHGTDDNLQAELSKLYGRGARVLEPYGVLYYVADTGLENHAGDTIRALYRKRVVSSVDYGQALVNGISHLTVRYGVDRGAGPGPEAYTAAAGVAVWKRVVAVRVGFVAVSREQVAAGPGDTSDTLWIFDRKLDNLPANARLRRVFTTTVALRNRIR